MATRRFAPVVSKPEISVLLCTHNPRPEFVSAAMDGLRAQTLSLERWELIVVDNGSTGALDLSRLAAWQPRSCIVREDQIGLTHARLRAFAEASGDLFVLVDDDNVLKPDFLDRAIALAREWPFLGAFGGQSHPRWEQSPPD